LAMLLRMGSLSGPHGEERVFARLEPWSHKSVDNNSTESLNISSGQ
jgi:hypothetical protein